MKTLAAVCTMSIFALLSARGVILYRTGDTTANTTAPAGPLANSGWQFEGQWGGLLGTPIAPHFFISAAHIGNAGGGAFVYQGATYTATQSYSLAGSDLLIWQVHETFPTFAPLYTAENNLFNKHLVVIGRGTQRGAEIFLDGASRGWNWSAGDGVQRWGENDVANLVLYQGRELIYATFDQPTAVPNDRPNEAHLSVGDSGGAIFIQDVLDGSWKLAGINFAVDDLYSAPSPSAGFTAAVFDARGYYEWNGAAFTQITGVLPVPTGFYASNIASEVAWIGSVIAQPRVAIEGNFLTLTYDKIVAPATDITYQVEQSTDLVSWSNATTQDEVLATNGDIQTIKAKIDIGTSTNLFLRLNVTKPQSNTSHPAAAFVKTVAVDNRLHVLSRRRKVDVAQKIAR
ncbi:MAG: hypothetical protein QOG48_2421 [Verrucomicrobiota bacterium]|jgi:hypothetical protein